MSDDKTPVGVSYDYDESAAGHAEDFANRIVESAAYEGVFVKCWPILSKTKDDGTGGTAGIHFEFEAGDHSTASFDLYTVKKDGTKLFSYNMVMAMMGLMGVKGLKTKKGKIEVYDNETNKRVEVDGDTFPEMCGKKIGLVLQKELYTKSDGKEGSRMNLLASFQPETHLTMSEIKEKQTKPVKFERIMKGLRTKDSRIHQAAEPAQPSQGVPAGDY